MKRAFAGGFFSILATGTPQPLVGSALTAPIGPSSVPVSVPVSSSAFAQVGDWVLLVDPTQNPVLRERLLVLKVVDATHILVAASGQVDAGGVKNSFPAGAWVQLACNTSRVYLQLKNANAAGLWLGTDPAMSSATGAYCIAYLDTVLSGQPIDITQDEPTGQYPETPANYWVVGTAGDKYLATLGIV